MNEHIAEIAMRLRGLRDVLEIEASEVAAVCSVSCEQYEAYEAGESDIPVGLLYTISKHYGVEMSALMFGAEAHMDSYFLTRKGAGASVDRTAAYKYQSLAAGFARRAANPFLVRIEPNDSPAPTLNSHEGEEFNMVLSGRMLLMIDGKELTLEAGDSIYFDSTRPHAMKALDGEAIEMLAVII